MKNEAGKYVSDQNGTLSDDPHEFTIRGADSLTISGLSVGTYDVEETGTGEQGSAQISGYTLTVEGTGPVEVTSANIRNNPAAVSVKNTYEQSSIDTNIVGNKTLNGRPLAEGEFSFKIEALGNEAVSKENTPLPQQTEVTVAGAMAGEKSEDFVFGPITFQDVGTYSYRVTEIQGTVSGVRYDTTHYDVDVTVSRNGKDLSVAKTYTHVLEDTQRQSAEKAEFTNEFLTQDLSISKKVTGNGEQTVESFLFKVTLKDSQNRNLSGTYDVVKGGVVEKKTLTAGSFQISLKANERIFIKNLPVGTIYSVEEENYSENGYVTSVRINNGDSIESRQYTDTIVKKNTIDNVEFTNTRNTTGSLIVTKTVKGNSADRNEAFYFTVKLSDTSINGSTTSDGKNYRGTESNVDITFVNGEASFTLKHDQQAEIINIPNNTTYEVTETGSTYITDISDNDNTNPETGIEALKDGRGTINEHVPGKVDFTNTLDKYGAFSIEKKAEGNEADKKSWFAFDIRLVPDRDVQLTPGKYGDVEFVKDENGDLIVKDRQYFGVEASSVDPSKVPNNRVVVSKEHPIYVFGVPANTKYLVVEENYIPTYDSVTYTNMSNDGAVIKAQTSDKNAEQSAYAFNDTLQNQVIVTNTRNRTGKLGIYKRAAGNAINPDQQFKVRITLRDEAGNLVSGIFGDEGTQSYTFTNGVCEVIVGDPNTGDELYHDGVVITGIPTGYTYSYEEVDSSDYTVSIIETVQFDNKDDGSGTVVDRGPVDKSHQVTVGFDDEVTGAGVDYYDLSQGGITGRDKNGKPESEVQVPGKIQTKEHNLFITNEKWSYGALILSKEVEGTTADTQLSKEFNFMVTIDDLSEGLELVRVSSDNTRNNTSVSFVNGIASIGLKSGEKAVAIGLKTGSSYIIKETTDDPLYVVNSTDASGTITEISTAKDYTDLTITNVLNNGLANRSQFTNQYSVGNLTVQKKVQGNYFNENDKFKVKVTLTGSGSSFSGVIKNGNEEVKDANGASIAFTDGIAEFTVKANSSITLYGLPHDVQYSIEETDKNGYELVSASSVNLTGAVPGNSQTVIATLVNEKNGTGSLKLSKEISGNAADEKDVFTFAVKIDDDSFEGDHTDTASSSEGVTAVFSKGEATVSLKGNQYIVIKGIPNGAKYTITETDSKTYQSIVPSNNTGTIDITKDRPDVQWENNRVINGRLELSKVVTGNSGDKNKWFEYEIALKDLNGNPIKGTYSEITFDENGVATVRLQDGLKKTITGLPVCTYTIKEINASDYTITTRRFAADGASTISIDGSEATVSGEIDPFKSIGTDEEPINQKTEQFVEFTNNLDLFGGLSVTKRITGNAADTGKNFQFELTVKNKDGSLFEENVSVITAEDTSGVATFTAGKYSFTLSNNQTLFLRGLPNGASYELKEKDSQGYDVGYDEYATGVISPFTEDNDIAPNNKTIVTNTLDTYGGLKIVKKLAGNALSGEENKVFTMRVSVFKDAALTQLDSSVTGQKGDASFSEGTAVLEVSSKTAKEITGLPNGDYVFVSENDYTPSGYDPVSFDKGTVKTVNGRTGVCFEVEGNKNVVLTATNTRNKPKLIVKKSFAGDEIDDSVKKNIKFVVTGPDDFREEFRYQDMDDGGEKLFENLTPGGTYTVTETNADVNGYVRTTVYEVGSEQVNKVTFSSDDHTEVKTVNVTNTYDYKLGNLKVSKKLTGVPAGNSDKKFKVTIRNTATNRYLKLDGTYSSAPVELEVSENHPIEIKNIEIGEYVVSELEEGRNIDDYSVVAAGSTFECTVNVTKNGNAVAELVNAYEQDKGKLTLVKTLVGAPEDSEDKSFTVSIRNSEGKYLAADGSLSETEVTHVIKKTQSLSIDNVPVGKYTITEKTDADSINIIGYRFLSGQSTTVLENVAVLKNQETYKSLVNRYEEILTDYKVEKIWDDAGDSRGLRPEGINVVLLADGDPLDKTAVLNTENDWKHTFTDLPKYRANGNEIHYSAREYTEGLLSLRKIIGEGEKSGDNYRVSYEGKEADALTITNRLISGSLSVEKHILGNNSAKGDEFSFKVTLSQPLNGTFGDMVFKEGIAEFKLGDGDTFTASELPVGIKYEVSEASGDYVAVKTGETGTIEENKTKTASFTNYRWKTSIIPEVKKTVEGKGAPDETYQFVISGDSLPDDYQTARTAKNNQSAKFDEITFTEAGTHIYKIREVVPEVKTEGMTYSDQEITVKAEIKVKDSLTGELQATVTYSGGDGETGNVITNEYDSSAVAFIIKTDRDISDSAYVPEQGVQFQIYDASFTDKSAAPADRRMLFKKVGNAEDGSAVYEFTGSYGTNNTLASESAEGDTLETGSNGVIKLTGLPKDAAMTSIETKNLPGYENCDVNPATPLKSLDADTKIDEVKTTDAVAKFIDKPVTVPLTVNKVFSDGNTAHAKDSVEVTLYMNVNGTESVVGTKTLSADTEWKGSWTDLRLRDDSGNLITYRAEETAGGNGYKISYSPGNTSVVEDNKIADITITNTKEETHPTPTPTATPKPTPTPDIPTTEIKASKRWVDSNNADGRRPGHVTVHLLADGVDTGLTAELSPDNNWQFVWYALPVYNAEGNFINYTVAEDTVPGYSAEYSGSMTEGYVITNKKRTVPKTEDNFDALRLQAVLLVSLLGAMLSSILLRKLARD